MKKIIVVLLAFLLCGCQYINSVDDALIKSYLNNSYGSEKGFEFLHDGICNLYEVGYCSSYYKSNDLDDEIYVIWHDGSGNDITDDYLFKKYQNQIAAFYKKLFDPYIDGNYTIEILSQKSDMNWKKDAIFEDILKYEKLNLSIGVNIISNDKSKLSLIEIGLPKAIRKILIQFCIST